MPRKTSLKLSHPGTLPLGWTTDKLKKIHTSIPANPLLAEPMYLKGYIERVGSGTLDMVRIAQEFGLPEPMFEQNEDFRTIKYRKQATGEVTGEVSGEVHKVVLVLENEI